MSEPTETAKKASSCYQGKTEPRAIILYKLKDTNFLKKVFTPKKEYRSYDAERYEIAWR
jgi:hypothetical protein